jgi:hypothetical protein
VATSREGESKRFFFEKKKQKTFICRGCWHGFGQQHTPRVFDHEVAKSRAKSKSFLLLFFKKEALAYLPPSVAHNKSRIRK